MALPDRQNDPVLVLLAKIRGQVDEVVDLVKEERQMLTEQKRLRGNATDK
jgi:hypothetical protein